MPTIIVVERQVSCIIVVQRMGMYYSTLLDPVKSIPTRVSEDKIYASIGSGRRPSTTTDGCCSDLGIVS